VATRAAPILERILESRRAAIARLKAEATAAGIARSAAVAPSPADFRATLVADHVTLIAECKERSPSGGWLQRRYDPVGLARRYVASGAAAVSVLTEPEFFGGSLDHLQAIRAAVQVPLLCKDFVVDPVQVIAARAAGADAVLLIVAILDDARLRDLLAVTRAHGMQALVEVHDEPDVERALQAEAAIIGINNRDLTTMRTDKETTARLRPLIPSGHVIVSESGIDRRSDIQTLERLSVNAALVGESLLRAPDLEAKVRELSGR
jgi:indole-3-glycerol phosphate synthase